MHGDADAVDDCVEDMMPIMKETSWFENYGGKVQGAIEQACQSSPSCACYAICVEGGPMSRVEATMMGAIVEGVCGYDKGNIAERTVDVFHYKFPDLKIAMKRLLEDLRSHHNEIKLQENTQAPEPESEVNCDSFPRTGDLVTIVSGVHRKSLGVVCLPCDETFAGKWWVKLDGDKFGEERIIAPEQMKIRKVDDSELNPAVLTLSSS